MKEKNAQVSMEYVIIFGFILFITIPLILIFYEHTESTNDQIITSQVDKIVKKEKSFSLAKKKISVKNNKPERKKSARPIKKQR